MTENKVRTWPKKFITPTNLIFWVWPKFTTPTNINLTPKKYAGAVGLGRCPSQCKLLSYTRKKTPGTDIRRTPDVKLRFIGFNRFVGFNFGQIQFLRLVVVMVWSNSFGHLESVKLLFLIKRWLNIFCRKKKFPIKLIDNFLLFLKTPRKITERVLCISTSFWVCASF